MNRSSFAVAAMVWVAARALAQPLGGHDHPSAPAAPAASSSDSFAAQMAGAMRRMEQDMAMAHTGDADRDFAAMMIPHHQGAIDMAKAELQFGRDPVLRRLAQAIIVEQQQEIETMRARLDRLAPASRGGPVQSSPAHEVPKESRQ